MQAVHSALQGYAEHRLSTDNAWVETQAVNIHDDFNLVFPSVSVTGLVEHAASAKWVTVSSNTRVPAVQTELLSKAPRPCHHHRRDFKQVAAAHKAFFNDKSVAGLRNSVSVYSVATPVPRMCPSPRSHHPFR